MTRSDIVLDTFPLGFQWPTLEPFLFCVHHNDAYPRGNAKFGPAVPLTGRRIGMDFDNVDGFNMYHGAVVPGFPQHPHRGFETVTIVRRGYIDHSDSLGARARYGEGDLQWLTAGAGVVHAEMFPLLSREAPNPVELFQIWLNLPKARKMAQPHFSMLWKETLKTQSPADGVSVTVYAGDFDGVSAPPPPPASWASETNNHVGIFTIRLQPHAHVVLPAVNAPVGRMLYFFDGRELAVDGEVLDAQHGARLRADVPCTVRNGDTASELLILQARPIGEPVAQHGPFVMNTRQELQQAFADYQQTQFGGWPWPSDDPVHGAEVVRFAEQKGARSTPPKV